MKLRNKTKKNLKKVKNKNLVLLVKLFNALNM